MQWSETDNIILNLNQTTIATVFNSTELTINLQVDDERLFRKSLQSANIFARVPRLHPVNNQRPVGWILPHHTEPGAEWFTLIGPHRPDTVR